MPRPLRRQEENGIYHVNAVGVRRSEIFTSDADCEMFLALLGVTVSRYFWVCASYCLLGNHYHLLVQTREANIGRGMQFLNGVYAQWFNREHGTRGHVFATRYFDVMIESDEQLFRAARYIALNPVAAGLCAHPAEWKWSSYGALVGDERPRRLLTSDFLLSELSDSRERAHAEMRRLVEDLEPPAWPPDSRVRP